MHAKEDDERKLIFFLTWPYLYDWISNHQRPYINTRNFIFQHCLDWSHAQGVTAWITYVQKNQHKLANLLVLYSEVSSLDFRNYCLLYILHCIFNEIIQNYMNLWQNSPLLINKRTPSMVLKCCKQCFLSLKFLPMTLKEEGVRRFKILTCSERFSLRFRFVTWR